MRTCGTDIVDHQFVLEAGDPISICSVVHLTFAQQNDQVAPEDVFPRQLASLCEHSSLRAGHRLRVGRSSARLDRRPEQKTSGRPTQQERQTPGSKQIVTQLKQTPILSEAFHRNLKIVKSFYFPLQEHLPQNPESRLSVQKRGWHRDIACPAKPGNLRRWKTRRSWRQSDIQPILPQGVQAPVPPLTRFCNHIDCRS